MQPPTTTRQHNDALNQSHTHTTVHVMETGSDPEIRQLGSRAAATRDSTVAGYTTNAVAELWVPQCLELDDELDHVVLVAGCNREGVLHLV